MKILLIILLLVSFETFTIAQQKVIDSLQKQLRISTSDIDRVQVLAELSMAYIYNKPDSSIILGQEAYELSQQLHYSKGEALSLNRIAGGYVTMGDYAKGIQLYMQAQRISENIRDSEGIARSLNNIGDAYLEQDDWQKALSYFIQSKNIQERNSEKKGLTHAFIFANIGECYLHQNQLDSALIYEYHAYELAEKNHPEFLGYILRIIGEAEYAKGHNAEALQYFHESIVSSREVNGNEHLTMAYQDVGEFYQKIKQKDSAIYYTQKALSTAQLGNYNKGILDASKLLSSLYEGEDDKEALRYYKIAINAKDSLFSQEKLKQLLSISFEEKQRKQEIEAAKIEFHNKIKVYILLTALGMFLLLAIILYRNNRHKKKANTLLRQQKEEIQVTLTELKSAQSQLVLREKMASLGELTAGIAHEIQNPLNFVNNFSEVNREMIDEATEEIDKGNITEVKNILNDVKANEEKINHHGKRADAIVKGMLQHSQASTGVKDPTDISALCDEYLRLAYHGFRAKDKSFNADFKTDFNDNIGKLNIIPQDIGRVLLNLYNNAFYAVNERKKTADKNYQPTVTVTTKRSPSLSFGEGRGEVEIRVGDNGNGIPQNIVDKIFQPFFTTKPTGQGTGLGLSLSYDIIKAHDGEIKVETNEGEGTEFMIQLPV
jgi:signal transduction histidine kinase